MEIGNAIKDLRKKKGFKSQKEFAEKCGIPANTICQIEKGAFPQKETIKKICDTLEVPTSYLLLYSLKEEDVPEDRRDAFKALNESMKTLLIT